MLKTPQLIQTSRHLKIVCNEGISRKLQSVIAYEYRYKNPQKILLRPHPATYKKNYIS